MPDKLSDWEQIGQINELIIRIVKTFFEPFLEQDQRLVSRGELRATALQEIRDRIDKGIITHLAIRAIPDASAAIQKTFPTGLKPYLLSRDLFRRTPFSFEQNLSLLETIFLRSEQEIRDAAKSLHPEMRRIIACIACAIQDDTISAPITYYFGLAEVPDAAISVLISVLDRIEVIRRCCTTTNDLKALRDINQATRELEVQKARASNSIWLPLRSLVTASLSSSDLTALYARSKSDVEQLAHQIIGGDGIFLITGYRGVGKSTFINDALALLPEIQKEQRDSDPWYVVPIVVNLAKASSVSKVLSLCIRKMHETLLQQNSAYSSLLTHKEHRYLAMAYYRSAYKVNIQEGESVASLRHIEGQISWNFNPAGFLPSTTSGGLTSLVPTFGAGAKTSKDWNKQGSSTIALPDYDEDKAEEDIVYFIKMLALSRNIEKKIPGQLALPKNTEKIRIKLAFIFDEMDKMEVKEQKDLTNELKNLFLERNTVFMLVTSKEFYDLWWDERNVEDSVLASYFSCIKMVPLFTSKETNLLLKRLLTIGSLVLTDEEEEFLTTTALYLTYRARGVPRDIIRELQGIQQWSLKGVQAFITSKMVQYTAVLAYAEIQRALEGTLDVSYTSHIDPNIAAEPMRMETGYAWLQEGRYEQIRRGLYLLVEMLLDVETFEMNPDAELFKDIRDKSFKRITSPELNSLFNRLVKRLQSVQLKTGPGSALSRYYTPAQLQQLGITGTEVTFFLPGAALTAGSFQKISVIPLVYTLTGRSVVTTVTPLQQEGEDISLQRIEEYLKKDGQVLPQIGLDALKQKAKPFSEDINRQLCRIFLSGQGTNMRIDAAALLQNTALFDAIRDGSIKQEQLDQFIMSEVDERLLQEFLRLVQSGINSAVQYSFDGVEILLRLLERYKLAFSPPSSNSNSFALSATLSEAILIDAISTLAMIGDPPPYVSPDDISTLTQVAKTYPDMLEKVVACLNPIQDIPDVLLSSLQKLETKFTSRRNLVEILVARNFTGVSIETLRKILRGLDYNKLMQLWEYSTPYKDRIVSQRVLVCIIQQRNILSLLSSEGNLVRRWLNKQKWDENDQSIIQIALTENPDLPLLLTKVIDADKQSRLPSVALQQSQPTPVRSSSKPGGNWWLTALSALVMIAIYGISTVDLPVPTTLVYQLLARLLELGWLYLGVAASGALLLTMVFLFDRYSQSRLRWTYLIAFLVLVVITVSLLYLQISKYPLVVTFWGQTILIILLGGIIAVPVLVWYFVRRPATI